MGKLLTILGVTDQTNLTEEIITAENLIIGMQFIYENSPESHKKESLAIAIAETIRLTLQQIKGLPLTPPQAPQVISNVPRILTAQEFHVIYGAQWRIEVALDDKNNLADWVSPLMDKYLGNELTQQQINDLGARSVADLENGFVISPAMTTLNPKFNNQNTPTTPTTPTAPTPLTPPTTPTPPTTTVNVGDTFKHATVLSEPPYTITKIENGYVFIEWTKNGITREVDYPIQDVIDYIDNGNWIRVNTDMLPLYKVDDFVVAPDGKVQIITQVDGTAPHFYYDTTFGLNSYISVYENELRLATPKEIIQALEIKEGDVYMNEATGVRTGILEINEKNSYVRLKIGAGTTRVDFKQIYDIVFDVDTINETKSGIYYRIGDYVTIISDAKQIQSLYRFDIPSKKEKENGAIGYAEALAGKRVKIEDIEVIGNETTYTISPDGVHWALEEIRDDIFVKATPTRTKPTAKKGSRQGPEPSANDVQEGTKMKGNDGNMWVSRKTSKGYNQWKKIK
jgi:hypothetical protein